VLRSDRPIHSAMQRQKIPGSGLRLAACTALLSLLAACASHPHRPEVQDQGLSAPVATPGYYVVQAGDTLYAISLRFDRDYRELARINHLPDDDRIDVGQKLLVNPTPMPHPPHVKPRPKPVIAGTPAPAAAGVSMATGADSTGFATTALPPSPDFPDAQSQPVPPPTGHKHRHHHSAASTGTVAAAAASGTTGPLIAVPIPESADDVPAASARPPLAMPVPLAGAAVALVPAVAAGSHFHAGKNPADSSQVTENKAETGVPNATVAGLSSTKNRAKTGSDSKPQMTGVSQKQPLVGSAARPGGSSNDVDTDFLWAWPIKGQIIGHFGSGGLGNKGLDIAGRRGDAVLAAADGVVVYVGTGLVGYGKLIIIRHNNNYLSAYAHNDRFYVNEGDSVKVGEKIADVGSSGADRDELHFEIRRQGKPVDPLQYLPPTEASGK